MSILLDPTQKPAPATTGGAQTPPPVTNTSKVQSTAPTAERAYQSTFPRPQDNVALNGQTALRNMQLGNQAETAYQQAFPQRNPYQNAANQAAPVPQMAPPQKQLRYEFPSGTYQYDGQVSGRPEWNADEYKDSTPDGVGRNFLKTFYTPPTEEDYRKSNETTKRILALGNALRHIGNIINTSKGGPNQTFNDPVALAEQKYQNEKAQRQKDELDKENRAYKQSQLDIARDKAAGDAAYRQFKINLGIDNANRAERKAAADKAYRDFLMKSQDENNKSLQKARDENAKMQEKKFEEQHQQNLFNRGQAERRTRATEYRAYNKNSGGSGGGSGKGKYYGTVAGVPYSTKADYDTAVQTKAKEYNINNKYGKDTSSKTPNGRGGYIETGRSTSTAYKSTEDLAAEVEKEYQRRKNTPKKPAKPKKGVNKSGQSVKGKKF